MSKHASRPFESNGPKSQTHRDPASSSRTSDIGIVLEDAIEQGRFKDGDCAVLCPGCGESTERYYEGLPEPFIRFQSDCDNCRVTLRRWSVVVVPGIRKTAAPTDELRKIVQSYWEQQLRVGVVDDTLPHTREFSDETQALAETWDWDWEVTCSLCDRPVTQLDEDYLGYHHWEYENDVGTSVCHDCHDFLHGDDDRAQASTQDWRAKELGLADFRDLAVIRLALRDRAVHEPDLDEDNPEYAERLRRRYNVPVSLARITRLVAEVRHQDEVADTLQAHGPSPEVKVREIYPV
jgi:uncharacterized protein YlaI